MFECDTTKWAERAKDTWVKEEDANTKYFHIIAYANFKRHIIPRLIINYQEIRDHSLIKDHVFFFYKDIFDKGRVTWGSLSAEVWFPSEKVSDSANMALIVPFSEDEIRIAVFSMGSDKALGPDGFSMAFYQTYWDIIKGDLSSMFADFHLGNLDISKLNRDNICLIFKVDNAALISVYRPIGLLNCSYKIFF